MAAKKVKRSPNEDDSSSSSASPSDEMSADETTPPPRKRSGARRNNRKRKVEVIQEILEELKYSIREQSEKLNGSLLETKEMRKQLEKLTKSHSDLCKKLDLNTNGIRSQSDQVQPPRYRLEFKDGDIANTVDKDKDIEITVTLVDVSGRTVENGPLAKATVELVVVSAEFNQYDNQHNWSREDFERHIVTKQNSSMRNVCQPVKSIVSNGQFNLVDGECHSKFKIFSNSSNKKVRLGVMVVSPMEERVLEGLSKPFFVRGHDRPNRQKQKGQLPNTQDSSSPNSTLAGVNISGGNTAMVPPQPHSRQEQPASIQQYVPDWLMSDPDICWEGLCNSELAGAFGTQFNNHGLPTMRLMSEYFGLTVTIPKEDQQTCGKRGIVTEPREPDGSVEEVPLKRNLAFDDKTNITPTSFCARMLASAQEERIQVDISETFLMKDYSLSGQPHGSWFHHTDEELRPKDAATCLAARRDTRLMASKPTITNPTLPRLKGPTQCLPPPPPPRFMATARDMHPVAAKPTVPGVTPFTLPTRFWMTSSIASNPTITSEKGIPLTAHPMALKPTGPSVVDATLPTQISTTISMAPEHVFGSKDGTRQDGSSPLSVLFGLESHKRWVHSRENTPFIYGMTTQSTQIGKTEFAGRLHMSHTCFTHHCPLLLSSILSPPSSDSHHHLRQVSTPDPNRATYSDSSVPLRLVFPPSWCLSGVFINGSRSAYHDCCRLSSTHVSFVINAAAHPQILPPDGGSSLPPMATTERRSLHECVRNAVAGPAVGVHDARKGWWSRVVDWHFFVGFSFA